MNSDGAPVPAAMCDDDLMLIGQAIHSLRNALNELPACSREALLLHRIGGLPAEEIAVRLGINVCALEKHISAALDHLRRTLFLN